MIRERSRLVVAALCAALWVTPRLAHADVASINLQLHTGMTGGVGILGERKDEAFADGAAGVAYGGLLGVEILFVDFWVEHTQTLDRGGLAGTWTQFMLGLDGEVGFGSVAGGKLQADGSVVGGYQEGYTEFGFGIGFGVGTGQQIDPPLDRTEVTDKGVLAEVKFAAGYRLTNMVSLGVQIPVSAGYFIKSGTGVGVNDSANHYGQMSSSVLGTLRFHFGL